MSIYNYIRKEEWLKINEVHLRSQKNNNKVISKKTEAREETMKLMK